MKHSGRRGVVAAASLLALARSVGALVIITFVPETVLWLPRQLGYKG